MCHGHEGPINVHLIQVSDLVQILTKQNHHVYPVTDKEGHLFGTITHNVAALLLKEVFAVPFLYAASWASAGACIVLIKCGYFCLYHSAPVT